MDPNALTVWLEPTGLADLVRRGGPVVALLLALSVLAVAIAIAKGWQFATARVGCHGAAWAAVRRWQLGEAIDVDALAGERALACRTAALMMTRCRRASDPPAREAAREAAEGFAALRLHELSRFTGALDVVAQIAPLLGLFGTVLGMIEAFRTLEGAGAAVDPSVLAGGIWVALLTTAVGLAVAMPASVLAAWFEGRLANERMALDALIAAVADPAPSAAAPPAGARPLSTPAGAGDLRTAER